MGIKAISSTHNDPAQAAAEIQKAAEGMSPSVVIFFASSRYDPRSIAEAMGQSFPDAMTIGCSTAGEIISGKMQKNSVVAMVCEKDIIRSCAASPIDLKDTTGIATVLKDLASIYGKEPMNLDPTRYAGLILIDGLSCAEEQVMEKIGDLTDITIIGGSAGDDLAFKKTWIYYNGKVFEDAAILVLLDIASKFDFIKTQSFCRLGKKLMPTKVDQAQRKVLEFNGIPAVQAYAEATGTSPETIADEFMKHPVGLIAGDEPFVRSPQQVNGDALNFYCQIREGVELELLESTDIIEDTRAALTAMQKKAGKISGLINFNCILRTLQLEQEKKTEAYGALFSEIPTIGFSTYGEEYIGHINQTATMMVFY